MDLAKSMYLWGSPIEPADCDYEDSRDLGLTCIYCNQPVFLVKEKSFVNSRGTPVNTKAYFSHYKKNDATDLCELRTATPEGRELKEFAVGAPRGQRLRLYEERFKSLLFELTVQASELVIKTAVDRGLYLGPKQTINNTTWHRRILTKAYELDRDDKNLKKYLKEIVSLNKDQLLQAALDSRKDPENFDLKDKIITSEVLQFAASNNNAAHTLFTSGSHFATVLRFTQNGKSAIESIEESIGENSSFYTLNFIAASIVLGGADWLPLIEDMAERPIRRKAKGFG
jgi:hypothetical protein